MGLGSKPSDLLGVFGASSEGASKESFWIDSGTAPNKKWTIWLHEQPLRCREQPEKVFGEGFLPNPFGARDKEMYLRGGLPRDAPKVHIGKCTWGGSPPIRPKGTHPNQPQALLQALPRWSTLARGLHRCPAPST